MLEKNRVYTLKALSCLVLVLEITLQLGESLTSDFLLYLGSYRVPSVKSQHHIVSGL